HRCSLLRRRKQQWLICKRGFKRVLLGHCHQCALNWSDAVGTIRNVPNLRVATGTDALGGQKGQCPELLRRVERATAGLGFVIRSPYRKIAPGDVQGLPSSWGALLYLCRVLRPRRDRTRQALMVCRRGPRAVHAEGSPRVVLSRLNSTALALAVYASQ